VIIASFVVLMLQTKLASHSHCTTYPLADFIPNPPTKSTMHPNKRSTDITQERKGIYSFLENA
jgi:hypothetical protein